MTLIGMLHHRKSPSTVLKSYAYSAVAKAEGAELIYFSPSGVDLKRKVINGLIYKDGKWEKVESRYPDVVYNAGSPEKLAAKEQIINELRKEIPFTTYSIGNKMQVYKRLYSEGSFKNFLIPYHRVYSTKDFLKYLFKYEKVVLKPVNGHKGQGITYIEKRKDDLFTLIFDDYSKKVTLEELVKYVNTRIKSDLFIVQKYINSRTKDGNAFDFRLHSQKAANGKWVITAIYPRIGARGSIVSNINSGGSTNYLIPFLKQEFGNDYYNIKSYLEQFCLALSRTMDEIQLKDFNEEIDELGIDVGLDEHNKIWLFEVNWRPGCPPAFYLELDVVKNMILYCIYLSNKKKER